MTYTLDRTTLLIRLLTSMITRLLKNSLCNTVMQNIFSAEYLGQIESVATSQN